MTLFERALGLQDNKKNNLQRVVIFEYQIVLNKTGILQNFILVIFYYSYKSRNKYQTFIMLNEREYNHWKNQQLFYYNRIIKRFWAFIYFNE